MARPRNLDGSVQMISEKSEFFSSATKRFVEELKKYSSASSHYTVISIIGPQNSGKSYLLNALFGTKFDVLTPGPRKKTTKGIYIARCIDPCMIIMDVEGCDGRKRGEDDTLFERRSALFALTVSDVLLLNMFFTSISLNEGANLGLLKLIFEERVKIDAPNKKTKIVIVVRDHDYDQCSANITENHLQTIMEELWHEVHPAETNRKMSDYIEVIVKDLPCYKEKQEFAQKLEDLSKLLLGFAGSRSLEQNQCANSFAISSEITWNLICSSKRIAAANIKLAMSSYVCNEIVTEMLNDLDQEKEYRSLMSAGATSVKNFMAELLSFHKTIEARYVQR